MPRALVIAYNFPPNAAIGTMRTLRLIERLAADNWEVRVLTAAPSTYAPSEPVDAALLARVPASVRVIQVAVWRPYDALVRAFRARLANGLLLTGKRSVIPGDNVPE